VILKCHYRTRKDFGKIQHSRAFNNRMAAHGDMQHIQTFPARPALSPNPRQART
jgi:hypothetical protein